MSVAEAFRDARSHPALLRRLARFSLSYRPPTGFLRGLVVEHSGEHRGRLDLKHGGLVPIVDLARWAGMAAGVTSASTPERLRAAAAAGTLSAADAAHAGRCLPARDGPAPRASGRAAPGRARSPTTTSTRQRSARSRAPTSRRPSARWPPCRSAFAGELGVGAASTTTDISGGEMTSPPESARVVVVGGGIAGAGVAHHLAERGWDEIVVVDQGPLCADRRLDVARAGAGLPAQPVADDDAPGAVDGRAASPRSAAFHPVGGIEVATTDERWAELDRRWARARGYGLEARLLEPARGRRARPAARSRHDPRRPPRRRRRDRQGRARGRGAVPPRGDRRPSATARSPDCVIEGGRARRRADRARARSAPSTSSSPPASGAASCRALAAGSTSRSSPSSTSSPTPRRCPSWPGRRARSCTRSCATRTTRCTSARSPTPTRSATTATSRGWPSPDAPRRSSAFTPTDFARRAPRRAGCCRRCATSRSRAPSTG